MKKALHFFLCLSLMCLSQTLIAQNIQLKVELLSDGITYRVSMKPSVTWTAPNNLTLGAQITLLAPTGTFQLTNLTNINGVWSDLPVIVAPTENPIKDYFVISLGSSTALPYAANVETPLFTFQRSGACAGSIDLINNNTDPFMPPNSQSLNVGNYVATRGGGGSSKNLWSANYGGAATCPGAVRSCEVEYKLVPLSTGKYQVSMIPKVTWAGVLATTATQQITVVVPTGGFKVANLTNLVANVRYMQNSRFDAPTENRTKDYLVFNLQSLGTRNLSYVANVEVPLFTFENNGTCGVGNVELMNDLTDAFRAPNSRSANIGAQLTTIGGGADVPICLNTNYLAGCSVACGNPSSNFLGADGSFCSGVLSNLGIVSNFTNFQWTPTTGLTCANCASPQVTITRDTRYIVTATNPQTGCPVRDTLNLYVLPVPVITGIDSVPNISCTSASGSIVVKATISSGDSLEYSIDNGVIWQDSPTFNNLNGGTYVICARTKIDKCVVTFSGNPVFFKLATPPSVSTVLTTNITDCGLTNGSINIAATGNTSTLKYSINNGQTFSNSPVFNGLSAGNYTIVVTNSTASCSTNYPTTITVLGKTPPQIRNVETTQITNCTAPNGLIAITATGGLAPLQYSINGGQTWSRSPIFSNLFSGNYTLQVRNADSTCGVTSSAVVNACQTPIFTNTIQGRTFKTCDSNGIRSVSAQIMPNIVVILRGGTLGSRSATSDAQGFYRFDTVPQGAYNLTFGLPSGYAFGAKNRGSDRTIDSDVDPVSGVVNFAGTATNANAILNFDAAYRDIEAPVIIRLNTALTNINSGDTLTYPCSNTPIFSVADVTARDNSDTTIVKLATTNDTITRSATRIQFIDIAQKIGQCPRDGYAQLLECEWRATDYCGNRSTFKIFVKITDNQAPILRGVPPNLTVTSEANVPAPTPVTATDNCTTGIAPLFQQTQQNTGNCTYLLTRTWTATDECGNFATASQQITIQKNAADCALKLCTPSVLSQDSVVVTDACGAQPKACINLPKDILSNYTLSVNNQLYSGILDGCKFDTAVTYSYFSLLNRGATAPFNLDYWVVDGRSYSAKNIPSLQALTDTLNRIDPNGRWLVDNQNYCVARTNYFQHRAYGNMQITYGGSGSYAILQPNRTVMPFGTLMSIGRGRSLIALVNKTTGCVDSVAVYATCLTNSRVEVTLLKGQTKETCLDVSQMLGSKLTVKNKGPLSTNVQFTHINSSNCILIKAMGQTDKDSMVYVVTDEFGIHDTTTIVAKIQRQVAVNQARLYNDSIKTYRNKHIVFDVLQNDSINGNRLSMQIIQAPQFGKAVKTNDWRILYVPNLDYCADKQADDLTYSVCTPLGCDTATVKITVLCDLLRLNTGFSPNGDGINDYLVIDGIDLYPLSILRIYNRWGVKVLEKKGYKNNWDGTFKGLSLPDGTYFYQLDNVQNSSLTGYIQLNR
jgi:gliding motility-associated-like protein